MYNDLNEFQLGDRVLAECSVGEIRIAEVDKIYHARRMLGIDFKNGVTSMVKPGDIKMWKRHDR